MLPHWVPSNPLVAGRLSYDRVGAVRGRRGQRSEKKSAAEAALKKSRPLKQREEEDAKTRASPSSPKLEWVA